MLLTFNIITNIKKKILEIIFDFCIKLICNFFVFLFIKLCFFSFIFYKFILLIYFIINENIKIINLFMPQKEKKKINIKIQINKMI